MRTFRYRPEFHFGLLGETPDQDAAMVAFRAELKEHPERFTRFSPYFAHVSVEDTGKVVVLTVATVATVAGDYAEAEEFSALSRGIARNNALGSVRIRVRDREMPAFVALHTLATETEKQTDK